MTIYKGGCACGAIRYEVEGEPIFAGHCQCRDCQQATGGGHASVLAFPIAAVKLTGSAKEYASEPQPGDRKYSGFCPNCGSPLFSRIDSLPGVLMIKAGSLDDPNQMTPHMSIYRDSAAAWDYMDPALPSFPKMPPP